MKTMECPYFGVCGSCRLPESYDRQLSGKLDRVTELLSPFNLPAPEVFQSRAAHFRNRSEFRIWHDGEKLSLSMFRLDGSKVPLLIDNCPITNKKFFDIIPELLHYLSSVRALSRKLFRLDYLASEMGELLISLIYHKPVDENWREHAELLAKKFTINVIGRSKGKKIVVGGEGVYEKISAADREWSYWLPENCFTQPNGSVNRMMIEWAVKQAGCGEDFLELYCGIGNFTLPLSCCFSRGVAIELARPALRAAEENAQRNSVENLKFAAMSSEDFTRAMNGEHEFNRLRHIELGSYHFKTVLVDPPRAGLDPDSLQLVRQIPEILYISCNPESLARDLSALSETHRAVAFAVFDQFPYTEHLECGIKLVHKPQE